MQRINLFTSPDFSNGLWGAGDKTVANGELTVGPGGGDYLAISFHMPDAEQLVFSVEVMGSGNVQVYDTGWKYLTASGDFRDVADWTLKTMRFTPRVGKGFMVCFYHAAGAAIKARRPQLESAYTYDTAIGGGASGLLHRGHDATRLTPRTGTVVPDDGHEPMHEPILDHHLESRRVDTDHDRSERGWDEILGQCLCERHRRHYLGVWYRPQCKPTCQLPDNRRQFRCDVNELFRRVRQSDRHRNEYAHLHVCRLSGEQDSARQHRIFHRGYDAARLTLMGVMA